MKHLRRIERAIAPESTLYPFGCGEMTLIGEDISERLDIVRAQFRVLVTRRPRYACCRCSGVVVQAHPPEHAVPGGLPTEALIAQVIVSKFEDHLPFYRQAETCTRQGLALDRATLGSWVDRACFHLLPIVAQMREHLKATDWVFMTETRAQVLSPGRRRTKTGYFLSVVADDRGHGGTGPPVVSVHYPPGRGTAHALRFLESFRGQFVQCDGQEVYDKLTGVDRAEGPWTLVHCWTHARRRFAKRLEKDGSPIAEEFLHRIADLYAFEKAVRGLPPAPQLATRREHAALIIDAFRLWLEARLSCIPRSSKLAEDIRYTLGLWPGLNHLLEVGQFELDTNP